MSLSLNNRHLAILGLIILAVIAGRIILADTGTAPLNPGHPLSQTWIDTNLNLGAYNLYTLGNVGIGTTSPGQRLTVAGTVESTSGGFKFPDGTTQTTAASGVSTRNIVTGSRSIGTTYLNTAGKVMFVTTTVSVRSGACGSASSAYVKVGGTNPPTTVVASAVTSVNTGSITSSIPMSFVVLPNDYYRVDCIDMVPPCVPYGCPIVSWVEWY